MDRKAHFDNADLRQARFAGARMEHAHFEAANLDAADLSRTCLVGATYDGLTRFPEGFVPASVGMVRGDMQGQAPLSVPPSLDCSPCEQQPASR